MLKTLEIKSDTFLDLFARSQRGSAISYLIGLALVLVALLGRLAIAPVEAGMPFLTFFPAVTLATLLCLWIWPGSTCPDELLHSG